MSVPGMAPRPMASDAPRSSSSLDDLQLMLRIQAGDPGAFAAFYDRHATAVYRFTNRIVHSRAIAEDVTQDAFVAFWRARCDYADARGSARNWLLSIARNRAVDVTRRASYHRDHPLESGFDQEAPERTEREVLRRAEASTVRDALAGLPAAQREVIEMSYTAGLTQLEIADRLALPLGTVKSRMRLGLLKLRGELADCAPAFA
jgi:RNA polymerase sigma-70 factor, ECF subfamily